MRAGGDLQGRRCSGRAAPAPGDPQRRSARRRAGWTSIKRLDYPNYEVLVVDNGASDDSVTTIHRAYPGECANLGFAEGNTPAIQYALDNDTDAVVILDSDTIVDLNLLTAFSETYAAFFLGKVKL
jgi:hypothetical protein